MAKFSIVAGATSQSVNIFIQDSSSTTGAGLSGLVYNSSGLIAYYTFTGANATSTSITLATLAAVNSAYSSGGFKEIDATNMKGLYRLDIPNAALATSKGRAVTIQLGGATNMAPCVLEIELTGWDNQDGVHGGMSALPNTACTTNASLITSGTGTDQLQVTGGGAAPDWAHVKSATTTVDLSGTTVKNLDNNPPGYPANFGSLSIDGSGRVDVGKVVGTAQTAADIGLMAKAAVLHSGTSAGGGSSNTFVFDAGASSDPMAYNQCLIVITGGSAVGECQGIESYNGTTKTATLPAAWHTTPDNTSTFVVLAFSGTCIAYTTGGANTVSAQVQSDILAIFPFGVNTDSSGDVVVGTNNDKTGYGLSSSERNSTADAILARSMGSEGYAAKGAVPTVAQALFMLLQFAQEISYSGTTLTIKKLDGSTAAMTFTLDSATTPTSSTRAT